MPALPAAPRRTLLAFAAAAPAPPALAAAADPDRRIVTVEEFGAAGDGRRDDSPAFQRAADALAATGGEVRLGPKLYRLRGQVRPAAPIDWVGSDAQEGPQWLGGARPTRGTWLWHDSASQPAFLFDRPEGTQNSRIAHCAFWEEHPPVRAGWTPAERAACIRLRNAAGSLTLDAVHFHNPYWAVDSDLAGRLECYRISGQPLHTGIRMDRAYDMMRLGHVHFWPYWSAEAPVLRWMQANGAAFRLGRCDGIMADALFAFSYAHFFHLFAPTGDGGSTTKLYVGQMYTDSCGRAFTVDQDSATFHVSQMTAQGLVFPTTDPITAIPYGCGVVVNASFAKAHIDYCRIDQHAANAIRLRGQGNELSIGRADFRQWGYDLSRTGPMPAILLDPVPAGQAPNTVLLAVEPLLVPLRPADPLADGGGAVVKPVGMNLVGAAIASEVRFSAAAAGGMPTGGPIGAAADIGFRLRSKGRAPLWLTAGGRSLGLDEHGRPWMDLLPEAADDTAAAALSPPVKVGGLYWTGTAVRQRRA